MKKILLLLLVAFTLTLTVPAIGYAAPTAEPAAAPTAATADKAKDADKPTPLECPANTTKLNETQCISKEAGYKCPGGFVEKEKQGGKTVCEVGTSKEDILSKAQQEDFQKRLSVILAVQAFLNRLLWPVLVMIGGLLDNSLLFGSGMEPRLREIWIPIRNLVNIMFVIILVGIALYNILGIGDDGGNYSLKSALPRIVVGIIAVNFSFLGMKVMLDAVTVMTTAIFALPGQVSDGLEEIVNSDDPQDQEVIRRFCLKLKDKKINDETPTETQIKKDNLAIKRIVAKKYATKYSKKITAASTEADINSAMESLPTDAKANYDKDLTSGVSNQFCAGTVLTPRGKAFLSRYNSRNAALAMALNMSKIVFYEDIEISTINLRQLFTNTLFSVILYLVYAASFLALFIVLLARMVVLWIAVAISPVFVIALALPFVKEQLSGFDEIQSEFIQNLIAPITIGLSMTIGWIMLRGVQSLDRFDTGSSLNLDPTNGFPVEGLNTLQDLIVAVGVIAVVWVAVFAAANKTIAKGATEWMKGGLQTAGTWLVKTPLKNMPGVAVQIPGEEGKTEVTMPQLAEAITSIGEDDYTKRREFIEKLRGGKVTPPLRSLNQAPYNNDPNEARKMLKTYEDKIRRGDDDAYEAIKQFNGSKAFKLLEPNERGAITEIAEAGNSKKKRKDGAEKLFKQETKTSKSGKLDGNNAVAPTAPPDPSEVKIDPATATYGGKNVGEMEKDNANVVSAIKAQTQAIVDKLKAGGATEQDMTDLVRGYNIEGKRPKASEVRQFMNESKIGDKNAYEVLTGILNEAKIKTALGETQAPPAAPPTPPEPGPPPAETP